MKMYYKIIVSSIYTAQNNGFMSDIWKFTSNFYFSAALASNFLVFFVFIHMYIYKGLFSFLPLENKNIVMYLYFFSIIPIMVFNYLKVYDNKKSKLIIKKYKDYYNKRLFMVYFLISLFFSLCLIFVER